MVLENWTSKTIQPGQKFGRLTVVSTHKKKGTYKYFACCRCDCGEFPKYVRIDKLRGSKGLTLSCGCYHKEKVTKHGCWGHPLFSTWVDMIRRCHDHRDKSYGRYGGRGIIVCREWHEPKRFIEDMHPSYKKGLQIDRKDNDKGYCKSNCRWASPQQQQRNRSNNRILSFKGESRCLAEWAQITGLSYTCLQQRIASGWDIEKALTTPRMTAEQSSKIARDTRYREKPQ